MIRYLRARWNTVHVKLLRSMVLAQAIAILIAGVILLFLGSQNARSNMIQRLDVIANIMAGKSAASLVFKDARAAEKNLSFARNKTGIEQLCLYDESGHLFASYNTVTSNASCEAIDSPIFASEHSDVTGGIELAVPVEDQGDILGHLVLRSTVRDLNETRIIYVFTLCLALSFSLLIALYIGHRLVSRALLPLQELYKTAKIVAKNPLSDDRAKKVSDDEFGRVVDVFNNMLDAFNDENKALTASENRFRSLAENSPVGVYLKVGKCDYQYINSTWAVITGLKGADTHSFISRIDVRDTDYYESSLEEAHKTGKPQVIEYQYITPDGSRRALMEYVSAVSEEKSVPSYIGSLLDVTELKNAQIELEKLAFYDPLTQLPNRRFFRDHLEFSIARAHKENKKIAVYMVDLDDFKKVNDSLGHDIGDALLVKIASQLREVLYDEDVVSRMGGDEFMILLDNIEDPTRLDNASCRILDALCASVQENSSRVQVSGSIGAAIYPTDAKTPEELVRFADIALYNAKSKGGGKYSYYSENLDKQIKERIRLEHKLRNAIQNDELEVYIQPQYIATTRKLFWGEALIRWNDAEDGFISPEVFIPLAEDNGLIHEIGSFVLDTVCGIINEHREKLKLIGLDGVSVNLSAKQFFSDNFIETIIKKFDEYNIEPSQVEFELTESTVMDDVEQAVVIMESIRSLGCRLSIDDFGTGYSSLSYLKRFPITSLKIDRSFIRDIPEDRNDVEIACAIIAMAHNLGLTVVAEGVETDIQAKLLASYNCEYLQGYLLDRPVPIRDLLERADNMSMVKSG